MNTARPDLDHGPLRKVVTIRQPLREAFRLFTEEIDRWWPLATHSVGLDQATGVAVEPRVGGRLVESILDGRRAVWGTISAWDPPTRLAFTWHPGRPEEESTEVEVTFTPVGEGTAVELVHRGWDQRRDGGQARAAYDPGWDYVLGCYDSAVPGRP